MSVADLRSKLPEYAKDLKLNLDSVLSEAGAPGLNLAQGLTEGISDDLDRKLGLRPEMIVEPAMGKSCRLHQIGHRDVVDSLGLEQARRRLKDLLPVLRRLFPRQPHCVPFVLKIA